MAYVLRHVGASTLADEWSEDTAESIIEFATTMMEPEFEIWWYCANSNPRIKGGVKFTWDAENNDYDFAIEDVLDQGVEVHFQNSEDHVVVQWRDADVGHRTPASEGHRVPA